MNYELDRHLGTIIEEMFQERTMLESEECLNSIPDPHRLHEMFQGLVQLMLKLDRHKQELLNGVADMRTKLLNSYFFLIHIFIQTSV